MHFIRMLCVAAVAAPTLSAAQAVQAPDWPIAPGSRVRISSPILGDRKQTGSVVSATSDTLVFRSAKQSISTAISTPNIVRIEVARGTHSTKAKGALIGLLIGGLGTAAIVAATWTPPNCGGLVCLDFGRGGDAAFGGLLGGLGGTIVGALVGMRQTDTWVPVAVPTR